MFYFEIVFNFEVLRIIAGENFDSNLKRLHFLRETNPRNER